MPKSALAKGQWRSTLVKSALIDTARLTPQNAARRIRAAKVQFLAAWQMETGGSMLLVDEYFDAEDPRFVEALRQVTSGKSLAPFADRWKHDPRPWARRKMLDYLALPFDVPGHHPVVKRLFKQAEKNGDLELLAAFQVAFDRLVRRVRKWVHRYDFETRRYVRKQVLAVRRNIIAPSHAVSSRNPSGWAKSDVRVPKDGLLFTNRTRQYLRRRGWRFFRRLGFQRPADYPAAIALALALYRDEDLASGEDILENWGLVNACFRRHPDFQFGALRIRLAPGGKFNDLAPAPCFPELWQRPDSFEVLLSLVTRGAARLVRLWARDLVRKDHLTSAAALDVKTLLALLDHEDAEVQNFGAELFDRSPHLVTLPLDVWLALLDVQNPTSLAIICEAMRRHVSRERLSLAQCVDLACARAAPVAQLGLDFLRQSPISTTEARNEVARLAAARCGSLGRALAAWALTIIGSPEHYQRDAVTPFFDSLLAETRGGAWQWLMTAKTPATQDAALFLRLAETPYDDLRLPLIDELARKSQLPGLGPRDLTPVWSTVLLGVHRGGRQKLKAAAQLAAALEATPEQAESLVPVLATAIRSVRASEQRAGVAAIVRAVERRPELLAIVGRHFPELQLEPAYS